MKKPLLVFWLAMSSSVVAAQISAGTRLRETSFTLITNGGFSPEYRQGGQSHFADAQYYRGSFRKEHLATGWYLFPGLTNLLLTSARERGSSWYPTLEAGYFVRKYLTLREGLMLFGEIRGGGRARVDYIHTAERTPYSQTYALQGVLGAGLSYSFRDHWALTARADIASAELANYRTTYDDPVTYFNASGKLQAQRFRIGITRFIGGGPGKADPPAPKHASVYEEGQAFIGGDFSLSSNFHHSGTDVGLGFTKARFREPLVAVGATYTVRFAFLPVNISEPDLLKQYSWGAGVTLFQENYLPLAKNLSLFGRFALDLRYDGYRRFRTQNVSLSNRLELRPQVSPGIQYQLNNRWAVSATVGGMNIATLAAGISHEQSGEKTHGYSMSFTFSPVYDISNSGLSLRYFPGKQN